MSGRTYPVEVRYEPYGVDDGDDRDQVQAICDAVSSLSREAPGDILVFLSGEREIRDTADALRGLTLRDTEILPLYARLSAAEQHRVFEAHSGPSRRPRDQRRRDLAHRSGHPLRRRPGHRAHQPLLRAAQGAAAADRGDLAGVGANQRAGRCGRVADGIAIRLYSEEDFLARPEFTEPEILRTNLASVILQMTALGLGDIERFPFVEPPDSRNIRDGVDLLRELGALRPGKDLRLTEIGRRLARLPLDPRLGRMVLEAEKAGRVAEVLVIASALSIQDPRERPVDKQAQADQLHARFRDPTSDFLVATSRCGTTCASSRRSAPATRSGACAATSSCTTCGCASGRTSTRSCARRARSSASRSPLGRRAGADPAAVHRALVSRACSATWAPTTRLAATTSVRAARAGRSTPGRRSRASRLRSRWRPSWSRPRGCSAASSPGSTPSVEQRRGRPRRRSVLRASLVEEARRRRRRRAGHAVRRTARGRVAACSTRRIDPVVSRDLFLRHALVQGEWDSHHAFVRDNERLRGRGGRGRGPRAPARPARRRRGAAGVLRRSGCRPTSPTRARSTAGGRPRAATRPTCSPTRATCSCATRRGRRRRRSRGVGRSAPSTSSCR